MEEAAFTAKMLGYGKRQPLHGDGIHCRVIDLAYKMQQVLFIYCARFGHTSLEHPRQI